jgi:hypothetical protein
MSLELALQEATAAMKELVALLRNQSPAENNVPITASAAEDPPKTKRVKKEAAPEAPAGEPAAPEESAPSTEPTATDAPATEAAAAPTRQLEYADVSEATLRLVKVKGTKHVKDLLAKYNYGTAKDIPMDMWPAWIEVCNAETEIPF